MKRRIVMLGSTGSIGTQCLDVCRQHDFEVVAIAANSNIELLEKQAREFSPKYVVVSDTTLYPKLKSMLKDTDCIVLAGYSEVERISSINDVDIVVNAITGIAGLRATITTLEAGNQLALANKEALVVGGELVMKTAKDKDITIYPIDSEHSAIWQSLRGGKRSELAKIILTASGGPFFGMSENELEDVTVKDALAHPNWSMGKKITIDSATLMNKGLEFIEAMWLFDLKPEQIATVVHRQSVIHSAVQFVDGSVIAQMGNPDMRVAIQYAITYPDRLPLKSEPFSLIDYGQLTFDKIDKDTFTCFSTCVEAAKVGGFAPAVVNGANEEAVALFLNNKIGFTQIGELVKSAFNNIELSDKMTIEALETADRLSREHVNKLVGKK